MPTLTVATCQFPVDADITRNQRYIARQLREAKERGAHVAHFPEGALSGYAGVDFQSFDGFDWDALKRATAELFDAARSLGLWLVVGTAHQLGGTHKPHNSLYIVDDRGAIVDRYDKRFCAGPLDGSSGDLVHYSPGNHAAVFEIHGVRCGALICHDYRYPELYRDYKRRGVELVFHSYHAANASPDRVAAIREAVGVDFLSLNPGGTYPAITMPATMIAAAAASHVWISCPNSSARESLWPSFFVRADGVVVGRLRRNVPGVLITTVDTSEPYYDSTVAWRDRAIAGTLHSGALVDDPRSADRTAPP